MIREAEGKRAVTVFVTLQSTGWPTRSLMRQAWGRQQLHTTDIITQTWDALAHLETN